MVKFQNYAVPIPVGGIGNYSEITNGDYTEDREDFLFDITLHMSKTKALLVDSSSNNNNRSTHLLSIIGLLEMVVSQRVLR